MPRGQKTPIELKEKCKAIVAATGNIGEASRQTGIPRNTIKGWVDETDGFEQVRKDKKQEFIDNSWQIINSAQELIKSRIKRAKEFDELLDMQIELTRNDDTLSAQEKVNEIEILLQKKAENTKDLSVILGTLYDKQALANKEATAIVDGNIGIKKFEDL